jgi:hypothetical protein
MSGHGSKKATRDLARRGAAAKKVESRLSAPGSAIITFNKPVHPVPWWRGARDEDHKVVYTNSGVNTNGDILQVVTRTPAGTVNRLVHWRDVDSVVVVPPISSEEPVPPDLGG